MLIFFIFLKALQLFTSVQVYQKAFSFSFLLETGLQQAWIYALVLYISLLFLAISFLKKGKKIDVKRIISYVYCFFIVTTALIILSSADLWTNHSGTLKYYPGSFFMVSEWIVFPVAWIIFFFIFRQLTINRN
jgi:hypothetical protein